MRKSHFNDEFLVLLGPIISMFFACSNEEKNKAKQQRGLISMGRTQASSSKVKCSSPASDAGTRTLKMA